MPSLAPAASTRRRQLAGAAFIAVPALWLGVRAQQAAPLRATPAQTEGPFYPVRIPDDNDSDLLRTGTLRYTRGTPARVEGTVTDLSGQPLRGARVEIWQCDEAGHYHHPGDGGRADAAFQGFGQMTVGADGRYAFQTIRPVAYGGRTPHIHVKVKLGNRELLTTQLYVRGDPGNERDMLWRNARDRDAITVPFSHGAEGVLARFPIVVAI